MTTPTEPLPFPDISGDWAMEIVWHRENEGGKLEATAFIRQEGGSVAMTVRSPGSDSRTIFAQPGHEPSGEPVLRYMYQVTPKTSGSEAGETYNGAAILHYYANGELSGNYWTSRFTRGHFKLERKAQGNKMTAVSGYGELDRKILEVRRALREEPMIPEGDIRSVMTLLPHLANLAGASVQDALYPIPVVEAVFEKGVRDRLRGIPNIGSELEQQAQAAGGRTDLSFRGVRLELKSERTKRLLPEDCAKFVEQSAMYAVGTGKRVAVLCVLDCSPKTTVPLPLGSCLFLHRHDTGAGFVSVVTVLVQGGFPKPSAFSR